MRFTLPRQLRHTFLAGLLLTSGLWSQDPKQLEGDWTMKVKDKKGDEFIFAIFVLHVDGNRLTGYMGAPGGTRRVPLEGETHGAQFTFTFDQNTVTGKMLSNTSIELTIPGREGARTYVVPKTPGASKSIPEAAKAINGVDQSTMGPYRALATLAYEAFQKGELDKAATFAQLLGRVWDQGEMALNKKSPDLWLSIDKAIDEFVGAVKSAKKKAPDPAKVEALYRDFLEKLKPADK
jgi:hypothetical protein